MSYILRRYYCNLVMTGECGVDGVVKCPNKCMCMQMRMWMWEAVNGDGGECMQCTCSICIHYSFFSGTNAVQEGILYRVVHYLGLKMGVEYGHIINQRVQL